MTTKMHTDIDTIREEILDPARRVHALMPCGQSLRGRGRRIGIVGAVAPMQPPATAISD